MTAMNIISFREQGVYEIVNNLGSLAPRLIFMRIEHGCQFLFSNIVQEIADLDKGEKEKKKVWMLEKIYVTLKSKLVFCCSVK